ncbi:hypothetical protein ABH922_004940 [Rhodococcus sp. 27YEA15]|uniref:PIN domain-containing protein n=1 Tax=Rhodococcus sp. 27YEA15 TaxID=3156259 RepID=UPI003C79AA67
MIIVLDSSALGRGALFESAIADARAHGHRVVVPRLAVLEVAGRYRDESAEMIAALSVQARMYDRLGLRRDLTRFVDAAQDKADSYVGDVVEELVGLGVEVLDPVDASHLDVAARAISLRRPYVAKKKRDGYPVTMNWLTVLDLADRNPDSEVVWVSSDTTAFGDGEHARWHDDIRSELVERALGDRLRWALQIPAFGAPGVVAERIDRQTDTGRHAIVLPESVAEPSVVVHGAYMEAVYAKAETPGAETPGAETPGAETPDVDAAEPATVAAENLDIESADPVVDAPAPKAPEPVAVVAKPVQRAARTRVAPQRIPPAPKPPGGLRGLGKVIGGRKRKITVVEELDDVDFLGR